MSSIEPGAKQYAKMWSEYGLEVPEDAIASLITAVCENESPLTPNGEAPALESQAPFESTFESLEAARETALSCTNCSLCETRTQVVFGEGNPSAKLMFVGEGPGADEDKTGRPFVGKAGQLLNKIIAAMKQKREEVYIANVVKCRPPENRTPLPEESQACSPFLKAQIEHIQPDIIVALGAPATQFLTDSNDSMGKMRGKFQNLHWNDKIKVMPTYHPAYLLRNPNAKAQVWADMQQVMQALKAD